MNTKKLRRPCKRCDQYFEPTGRFEKLCPSCLEKAWKNKKDKSRKYNKVPIEIKVRKVNGDVAIIKSTKTVIV